LGSVASIFDGTHQTPNYVDDGVMFLSVENINTLHSRKYISEVDFLRNFKTAPEFGDILMTRIGDIGTANVVRTNEKLAYYVSLSLLKPKDSDADFLATSIHSPYVQKELWERTLHVAFPKKINLGEIENVKLRTPTLPEQTAIGNFFHTLDTIITANQQKLSKLKQLKAAYLQQMFPQVGERVPRVRFEGFTGEWAIKKLSDFVETSKIKNRQNQFTKQDVLSVSGEHGIVNQIQFQGRSFAGVSVTEYGVVATGDIVYTKSPLKSNPHGIIKTNTGEAGIVSTLYAVYKPAPITNPLFVQYYFEYDRRLNSYLKPLVNKGAKNDMKVSDDNALVGDVVFPCRREQDIIVTFLRVHDEHIANQAQKLERLGKLKSIYLRKMFI